LFRFSQITGSTYRYKEAIVSDQNDQLFDKVQQDLDPFKKILGKIPGFKGYIERQARRDSDKLLRETIFQRFRELEDRVSALQRDFIKQGEIMHVDDLEASAIKLRTFADRIRTATRGYSSLFEATKINEEELQRLYEYDLTMLDLVDEVGRAIDNVQASLGSDGLPASLRHLESTALKAIDVFNRRDEVVLES
jgi:hypothetical protein